jgi:hypothetical protein
LLDGRKEEKTQVIQIRKHFLMLGEGTEMGLIAITLGKMEL